jgi:hypothetical protein
MLREIDRVLLAEAQMEEMMQDEVDRALESETYYEPWHGFTGGDSVSVLPRTHPETYSSVMQRDSNDGYHSSAEAQCSARTHSVQEHSPNVDFTSRTSQPHSKILHARKFELAKSKPRTGTAKTKKNTFLALPGLRTRVRVRRRYLYPMH